MVTFTGASVAEFWTGCVRPSAADSDLCYNHMYTYSSVVMNLGSERHAWRMLGLRPTRL